MRCINLYPSCQQAACDIVVVLGNRCGYVRNGDGNINIEPINDPTGSLRFLFNYYNPTKKNIFF